MKIRNIAFSGFMASILMAGAASADTTLATTNYVQGAYNAAVVGATSELGKHAANTTLHPTTAKQAEWDAKQGALSTAQLAAANSGITAAKVSTYDGYAATIDAKANASDVYTKDETFSKTEVASAITDAIDDISGVGGSLTTLQATVEGHTTSIANNATAISNEVTRATGAEGDLSERITSNTNKIGDASSGLTKDVADLKTASATHATTSALTAHTGNGDIHVTAAQKTAWTAKQDALDATQMAAVNSGINTTKVAAYDAYATGKQDALDADQLAAVGSGITAAKVSQYDGYDTGKQDTLTADQLLAVNSGITATKLTTDEAAIAQNTSDIALKANSADVYTKTVADSTFATKAAMTCSTDYCLVTKTGLASISYDDSWTD